MRTSQTRETAVGKRERGTDDTYQHLSAHQERENGLITFEQTTTDTRVHGLCDVSDVQTALDFYISGRLGATNAIQEKILEELKRVLVHRINSGQISHHKVENRTTNGNRTEFFTCLI